MAYICISKGRGFSAWLIRFFTSVIMRKDVMIEDGVSLVKSWWYLFLARLNKGPYAKIKSTLNHAFIIYKSEDFQQMFSINIEEDGPLPVPVRQAFSDCKYIKVYEPTFDLFTGVRENTRFIDTGYDWWLVIFSVLAIWWYALTNYKAKKLPHSPKRNVCSEFVVRTVNASKGAKKLGSPPMIYPQKFDALISDNEQYNLVYEGKPGDLVYSQL